MKKSTWGVVGAGLLTVIVLGIAIGGEARDKIDTSFHLAYVEEGAPATVGDTIVVRLPKSHVDALASGERAKSLGLLLNGHFLDGVVAERGVKKEDSAYFETPSGELAYQTEFAHKPTPDEEKKGIKETKDQWSDEHGTTYAADASGKPAKLLAIEGGLYRVQFRARRTPANAAAWADAIQKCPLSRQTITVSVGSRDGVELLGAAGKPIRQEVEFRPVRGARFWLGLLGVLWIGLAAVLLAWQSDLLRDRGPAPVGKPPAMSLARTQLGCWTLLAALGFVYLWALTGETSLFSTSVLTLLGIAAGTTLAGGVVDQSKATDAQATKLKLLEDVKTLRAQEQTVALSDDAKTAVAALKAAVDTLKAPAEWTPNTVPADVVELAARIPVAGAQSVHLSEVAHDVAGSAEIERRVVRFEPTSAAGRAEIKKLDDLLVAATAAVAKQASQSPTTLQILEIWKKIDEASAKTTAPAATNALTDLLTDAQGVALHRLQLAVWNVVLGVLFAYHVVTRLEMPAFDSTLLTLVGISGGTYLGFKIPEKPQ